MTPTRSLNQATKGVLEDFEDLVYTARQRVRDLSDVDLRILAESPRLVSSTNCSWAAFQAAGWPWLQDEVRYELRRRGGGSS